MSTFLPIMHSVLATIISHTCGCLIAHLGYTFKLKGNILKLINFKKRLGARREDIRMKIEIAERRNETCKHEVKEWPLQRVATIEIEIEAIKEAYDKRSCVLGHPSLDIISNHRLSKGAVKKLQEAVELYHRSGFDDLTIELSPPKVEEKSLTNTIVGVENNVKRVLGYLRDKKIGIIGIWGMGGVGKTTLLKIINNYFLANEESSRFDHVVCVTASKGCKLENLQMEIANKVGIHLKHDSNIESHASTVFSIMKKKKFLLLLDDLWERVDLERIGVPQPNAERSQKVVLATRFEEICGDMMEHTKIKLGCLTPNESWELFEASVGENVINFDKRIRSLAKQVCEECNGLPLALRSIGRAMSTKKTWQEWENSATRLRDAQLHEIPDINNINPMLNTLKFSYDSLVDHRLKECFLTCALWPEGYSIWIVELINCWIGLGLLPMQKTIHESYNEGYSCIGRLKEVCLLEDGDLRDSEVRLHDVIRDMALWIVSEHAEKRNWIVDAGTNLKRVIKHDSEKWACAEWVSLMCNYIETLPHSLNCPSLSLLMLQQKFSIKTILQNFFQNISFLAYLDLSWIPIKELPRDISLLGKLQYLNLANSEIISLPVELGCLTHLRFLNLSYTNNLKKIPNGVVSKLSMLEVLNLFQSGYSGFERMTQENDAENVNNEFNLEELHQKCLKSLGISVRTVNTINMISKFRDIYLSNLGLYELKGESRIYLPLGRSVKVLNIKKCFTLEELFIELEKKTDSDFHSRLEYLTFWRLHKLRKVNLTEPLLYLRTLTIMENNNLTDLTWILQFPFLDHIDLSFCNMLKQIIDNVEHGDKREIAIEASLALSKLRILQMNHLPLLEKFCGIKMIFPSLEYMDVYDCPFLKELPFETKGKNTNNLRQIRGEKVWWETLDWENPETAIYFQQFFRVFEKNIENFVPSLETNPFMSSTSSFFSRREPMVRITMQFSAYLCSFFGYQDC